MKKGFTLIELLIVVAIIGIIAGIVVGVTNASRVKAKTNATKASLSGLRSAIASCCERNGTLLTTAGGDICNPAINLYLPTAQQLNSAGVTYQILGNCNAAEPGYTVTLTGHSNSACNSPNTWTITVTRFIPPSGCR